MLSGTQLNRLMHGLSEAQWDALLRLAGLRDDRPTILREGYGSVREGSEWFERHLQELSPVLPRFVGSGEVGVLFASELLRLRAQAEKRFNVVFEVRDSSDGPEMPMGLDALTAAGVTLFQLYVDVSGSEPLKDNPEQPPHVTIGKGSVQFSFGGSSLLISGISLVVACSVGLVSSPLGLVGGVGLVSIGMIDQLINWRKTLADTSATRVTMSKTDLERKKLELEIKEKELAIRERETQVRLVNSPAEERDFLHQQLSRLQDRLNGLDAEQTPASAVVPFDVVKAEAERNALSVGLAHFLLNRALPSFVAAKSYFRDVRTWSKTKTG